MGKFIEDSASCGIGVSDASAKEEERERQVVNTGTSPTVSLLVQARVKGEL